jgi:hypothetical protein
VKYFESLNRSWALAFSAVPAEPFFRILLWRFTTLQIMKFLFGSASSAAMASVSKSLVSLRILALTLIASCTCLMLPLFYAMKAETRPLSSAADFGHPSFSSEATKVARSLPREACLYSSVKPSQWSKSLIFAENVFSYPLWRSSRTWADFKANCSLSINYITKVGHLLF